MPRRERLATIEVHRHLFRQVLEDDTPDGIFVAGLAYDDTITINSSVGLEGRIPDDGTILFVMKREFKNLFVQDFANKQKHKMAKFRELAPKWPS